MKEETNIEKTSVFPARHLQRGDCFTYVGAFVDYWVLHDPVPDPAYPGRLRIEAKRVNCRRPYSAGEVFLTIRLPIDDRVTLRWPRCVI